MVRSELISKLSKKIQPKLKKSDIEKIVSILLEAIVDGIKKNKSTEFRNFGRFSVKRLKKKISRNPRTGEKIHKAEKISIAFKMAKELKKKINEDERIN